MKKFIYSIFLILTALIDSNVVHAASTDYDGKWNGLISCTAYSSNATLGAFTRNNVYTIENGKVTSKYTTAGGKNVLTTTGVISGVNTNLTISGTSETAQWFFNFKGKPSSAENISYIGEMVEQGVKKRDCTMEFSALDPAIGSLAFKKINSNQIASSSQPIKTPTSEAAKSPVTPTVPPLTKNAAPVQPVQPATNPAPKVAEKATNPQSASVGTASFDCNKATSVQEKLICTTPALSSLDLKLAEVYKSAQATTADAPKLKNEQIAWIKETRACGGDATCLERFYNTRINELTPQPAQIATPSTAPNVAAQASAPVASEPALAASEQATPAPATPITTSPQASTVEEKTVPIWEDKYVKFGGGVVFALALLGLAYWLIKKLVLGLKKGATAAAKKGTEIRQDVAEKSALAKEKMVEKATQAREAMSEKAVDMALRASSATQTAAGVMKEAANNPEVKSGVKKIIAIAQARTILLWSFYMEWFRKSPWLTGFMTLIFIGVLFGGSERGGSSGSNERINAGSSDKSLKNPELIASQYGMSGVSECLAITTVWRAGLVQASSVKADGIEIKINSLMMSSYGMAKSKIISQNSNNPAYADAFDGMVMRYANYYGGLVRSQGWDDANVRGQFAKCRDGIYN